MVLEKNIKNTNNILNKNFNSMKLLYKINSFYLKYCKKIRNFRFRKYRKELRSLKITIFSKNCLAGFIYHTLGMEFCSPTINLFFENNDFYIFLNDLPYYLNAPLFETKNAQYISGILKGDASHKDLSILFVHYDSFQAAHDAWIRRSKK